MNRVYQENAKAMADGNVRIIANKGGTRSGKTYSIMNLLCVFCASAYGWQVDVVSESLPHLKRGVIQDTDSILDGMGGIEGVNYDYNRSDHIITFHPTESTIHFFSADDWGKVKGSSRDILFVNECNRIPWEVFRQLDVRTRELIFLDWNPDSEFWYERKGIATRENTKEIHSTYKDNPYLSDVQIASIEANKVDEDWWRVYGLGLTGQHKGLVYTNYDIVDNIPHDAQLVARGIDFGFTNDPTAIVGVYKAHGELWLDEECYLRGLTNPEIAQRLPKNMPCVADSAEQKSITEIRNCGVRHIEGASKGKDSINNGIDILRRYKMHVTMRSENLIEELHQYKWVVDSITGEQKNTPIDKFNHALDAVRYVALNKLNEHHIARRPRANYSRL